MKTDGHAGLLGEGPECGHSGPGASCHGQRKTSVAEEGPARGMGMAVDQDGCVFGKSGLAQGRHESEFHHGSGGTQGIATNAEHHGISTSQYAGGVSEDIGPTFENKGHDTERRSDEFGAPAFVLDAFNDLVASAGSVDPTTESRDHSLAQFFIGDEASGGPVPGLGIFHVVPVDPLDFIPDRLVGQAVGKASVEGRDAFVRRRREIAESVDGSTDCVFGNLPFRLGDEEQFLCGFYEHHRVTGLKAMGQIFGHFKHAVASEEQRGAGGELGQLL